MLESNKERVRREKLQKVAFPANRIPADLRAVFHPLLWIRLRRKERLLGQMLDGNAFVSRKGASVAEN